MYEEYPEKIFRPSGVNGGDKLVYKAGAIIEIEDGNGNFIPVTAGNLLAGATGGGKIGIPLPTLHPVATAKDILPDTPNGTTLGLGDTAGAALTGSTTSGSGTATATETALFAVPLPANYVAGTAVKVRLRARVTAARQVSATIDLAVSKQGDGALGADIVTTAAQALTTSYADKDFVVTSTSLAAGDILVGTITAAANDTGGNTNGAIAVSAVSVIIG